MYTIQSKVTVSGVYNANDFLFFILPEEESYRSLTKDESNDLLVIFQNNPEIFSNPFIREWNENPVLIDTMKAQKYSIPLTCDLNYFFSDLSSSDQSKLISMRGTVGGFNQRYVADNI